MNSEPHKNGYACQGNGFCEVIIVNTSLFHQGGEVFPFISILRTNWYLETAPL